MASGKRVNYERVRELYDQGLDDKAIALELNCSDSTVLRWRTNNDLESNGEQTRVMRVAKIVREGAPALYEQGLSDKEIADALGVRVDNIWVWRKKHGFAQNESQAGVSRDAMWPLYKDGMSDAEIALALGYPISAVKTWRSRNKLTENAAGTGDDLSAYIPGEYHMRDGYMTGKTDAEIADEVGCEPSLVARWRLKYELPSNEYIRTVTLEYMEAWEKRALGWA